MVKDCTAQERYLQYLSKRNDDFIQQGNGNINDSSDKRKQNESNKWEEWMKNQPISVLRLDRTERLVLKIGGWRLFLRKTSKFE